MAIVVNYYLLMAGQALPSPFLCDNECPESPVSQVPGPAGADGADGAAGAAGVSSFTTVANYLPAAQPTMPAEGASTDVNTTSSTAFMAVGSTVFVQNWGYMLVTAIVDADTVTLENPEDAATGAYASNAAPGTPLAAASKIVLAGEQGVAGTNPAGAAPSTASYIVQTADAGLSAEQALGALATGLLRNTTTTGVLSIATDGTDYLSPATGLEPADIGVTVQAFDAGLQSLSAFPTVADRIAYSTGANVWAEAPLTANARAIIAAASPLAVRSLLGIFDGYGRIGSITGVDLNALGDTAFTIGGTTRYIIDKIVIENASISLTLATAGVFTAAGGGGTTIAADQALSALTASTKFDDLTLQAVAGTDVFTSATLYFRVGTAQGAAATANVHVFGWPLN